MILTVIETGKPPEGLRADWPGYPEMMTDLLKAAAPSIRTRTISVVDGEALPDPAAPEAVAIMGSPYGVYDETPWMAPLRAFIRAAAAAKTPMAGICFGHQILADALGGRVAKSEKGWGVGQHRYAVTRPQPFMDAPAATFALNVSHQDQVLEAPPGAITFAANAHCRHAALVYADAPILSFQGHPEFSDAFSAALYRHRRGTTIPAPLVDAALSSLSGEDDGKTVAGWIVRFLKSARR